ncbi:hypothetical protein COF64_22715 [Bacillus sp. AFS043905]|nr:hypothetical protein COF64_22715 [Bacillus sp. AFS043905]
MKVAVLEKAEQTWDDYKIDFLDPSYILITRNREDAIERGYFQPSEYEYADGTNSVDAPTFIIKNQWGKELWLDGCNCGYGGQGPRGSERILKDIGLPAQIINQVFYRHIFELERNEEGTMNLSEMAVVNIRIPIYSVQVTLS